jgi:hypothetical protein
MVWRSAAISLVLVACSTRERTNVGEEEFVTNELRDLKVALTARDETKVLVGCTIVKGSEARLPKAKAAEIERLCHVDARRLFLENAIRDAIEAKAKTPEFDDVNCMQLLAGDAFEIVDKHPPADPELKKLVDEYTRLCPDRVAKLRARKP